MSHTSPYGIADELSIWHTKSSVLSSSSSFVASFGRGFPCTDLVGLLVRFCNGLDRYTSVLHLAACWIDLTPLFWITTPSFSSLLLLPYPRFSIALMIDLSSPIRPSAYYVYDGSCRIPSSLSSRLVISVMDLSILHLGSLVCLRVSPFDPVLYLFALLYMTNLLMALKPL